VLIRAGRENGRSALDYVVRHAAKHKLREMIKKSRAEDALCWADQVNHRNLRIPTQPAATILRVPPNRRSRPGPPCRQSVWNQRSLERRRTNNHNRNQAAR
jgi:hypothetical protein